MVHAILLLEQLIYVDMKQLRYYIQMLIVNLILKFINLFIIIKPILL